jgi:hypothetical protein
MDTIHLKKYYTEPKEKYNVISVCVFRIINNYRPTYEYYNGLKNLFYTFKKYFPDFYLRVYYDKSITYIQNENNIINKENKERWIPLIKNMKKNNNVQMIKYRHDDFLIKNTVFHQGLFGTLVRFIPLFNYESNNTKTVIISDIDTTNQHLNRLKLAYNQFKPSISEFHFRTRYCYLTRPRFMMAEEELLKVNTNYTPSLMYRVFAGSLFSKIKFPKNLLDDFINCMKNINTSQMSSCTYIKSFINMKNADDNSILNLGYFNANKSKETTDFFFGIDEFFINTSVLKYLDVNKIPISITVETDIALPFYHNFLRSNQFENLSKDQIENYTQFYKDVMGKYYDPSKTLVQNHNFMDKIINNISDNEHISQEKKSMYEYVYPKVLDEFNKIHNLNQYDKYKFTKKEVLCIMGMEKEHPYYILFKLFDYNSPHSKLFSFNCINKLSRSNKYKYKKYKHKYLNNK